MLFTFASTFLGKLILLIGITFSSVQATCVEWAGSIHSYGPNRNSDFVWAIGLDQLQFRFKFHAVHLCSLNGTNNSSFNSFSILLSGGYEQLFELHTSTSNCTVVSSSMGSKTNSVYARTSVKCFNDKNGYSAILTLVRPSNKLNGQSLILKALHVSQNDGIIARTKAITFKNCPSKLDDSTLQFFHQSQKLPEQIYKFKDSIQIKCKKAHSLLFAMSQGNYSKLLLPSTVAHCNASGQWSYKPVRCWHGQIIHINQRTDNHAVAVADKPMIVVCENTNTTMIDNVKVKVGDEFGAGSSEVSWLNVTLSERKHEHHFISASCSHSAKKGFKGYTEHLRITPKRIKFVEIHRHFPVRLGYESIIALPVYANFRLSSHHIVITKNGNHKNIKSFVVVTSKKDHHKNLIEVKFAKITEKDLGNYTAKIYIDKNEFDLIDFEIKAIDNSLSGGAIAAITVSVLLSCAVIAICFGYFVRKFATNQARVIENDGERILIIDDNDDAINDDVFHDPPRSARLQEELMRRADEPNTSSAPDHVFDAPSTSHHDEAQASERI